MKIFLLSSILMVFATACSKESVYNTMHEYERQQCLKLGHKECPRTENYEKYKKQRDEIITE